MILLYFKNIPLKLLQIKEIVLIFHTLKYGTKIQINIMTCKHNAHKKTLQRFNNIVLIQCKKCHLVFVHKQSNRPVSGELYKDYYKNEIIGRFGFGLEYIIRFFRFFRAFKIFTIYPRNKSILDIGSGRGFTLYYLKKYYKYNTTVGTQIEENSYQFSKKNLGLEIYNKDLINLKLEKNYFGLITMWHVLEHVDKPEKYIEKIYQLLCNKGRLIIEVPNFDSWTRKWTKKYWLGLDLKYHLTFFTPQTLSNMLTEYNFKIQKIRTFSLEYSTFFSAQSIISYLTKSNQLIFEWLQSNIRFRPILFIHILLFILLMPICFIINILLYFSKKGEILLIIAEK